MQVPEFLQDEPPSNTTKDSASPVPAEFSEKHGPAVSLVERVPPSGAFVLALQAKVVVV